MLGMNYFLICRFSQFEVFKAINVLREAREYGLWILTTHQPHPYGSDHMGHG